jgi:hypothetical protein
MTSCWIKQNELNIISPQLPTYEIKIPIKKELLIRDKNKIIIPDELGLIQAELLFGLNEILIYYQSYGISSPINKEVVSFFMEK